MKRPARRSALIPDDNDDVRLQKPVTSPSDDHSPQVDSDITNNEDDTETEAQDVVTELKALRSPPNSGTRNRHFKRNLSKEEKQTYGNDKEEYEKIVERVMSERIISQSVEALKERWKMLNYMYTDCMDMVDKWDKARKEQVMAKTRKDPRLYAMGFCGCVLALYLSFLLVRSIL